MKKVLITGGNGMLASAIQKEWGDRYQLHPMGRQELDITNRRQVFQVVRDGAFDLIIHTAADTNVEGCETKLENTYHVNTIGTQNLVDAAYGSELFFIYISSTGIYGKAKMESYTEFDSVEAPTLHHKSKFLGEEYLRQHFSNHLVLRTGWLFGASLENPKNFVYKRYLEALKKDLMQGDPTQFGNPTSARKLAIQIQKLLDGEFKGTFNAVSQPVSNRLEYVQKILEGFDLPHRVEPLPPGAFNRVAKVSFNEGARNLKLELHGLDCMGDWREELKIYINDLKKELNI